MLGVWGGNDVEEMTGGATNTGNAAGVAHDGTEALEQGGKAMCLSAVVKEMSVCFALRALGALSWCDGVASRFGLLVLIGEQQRAPGLEHVPLDVIGEHAQEDMRPDSRFEPVINGTHLEVETLH